MKVVCSRLSSRLGALPNAPGGNYLLVRDALDFGMTINSDSTTRAHASAAPGRTVVLTLRLWIVSLVALGGCYGPKVTLPNRPILGSEDDEPVPPKVVATTASPKAAAAETQSALPTAKAPAPQTASAPPPSPVAPASSPSAAAGSRPAVPPSPTPQQQAVSGRPTQAAASVQTTANKRAAQEEDVPLAAPVRRESVPEEVSAWKEADYLSAKAARDPRLLQAIAQLSASGHDKQADARFLARLIASEHKIEKPPADPASPVRHAEEEDVPAVDWLAPAVLSALVANGSSTARRTLQDILLGQFQGELSDSPLTFATLKALADGGASYEDTLFKVLTVPQRVRPANRGDVTAEALQQECLRLVEKKASVQFRRRIAEHIGKPDAHKVYSKNLISLFESPHVANVQAQVILCGSSTVKSSTKSKLNQIFVDKSAYAIDGLLGLAQGAGGRLDEDDERAPATGRGGLDRGEARTIAAALWTEQMAKTVAERLDRASADSLVDHLDELRLAFNLPIPSVRARLVTLLAEHAGEVKPLFARIPAATLRDPGALIVLKSMTREPSDTGRRPTHASKGGANGQMGKYYQQREAKAQWLQHCQALVQDLTRRFRAATQLAAQTAEESGAVPADRSAAWGIPLGLPRDAKVKLAYSADWPLADDDLRSLAVKHLKVFYLRAEVQENPRQLVAFFQKQSRKGVLRPIPNGAWLDGLQRTPEKFLRSFDVLITRQSDDAPARIPGSERLVVEVLLIEIPGFADDTFDR